MTHENATQLRPSIKRDSKVKGLHIKNNGWFLYYRTKDGQERRPKLGDVSVLSTTAAREIATRMLLEVAQGGDPRERERNAKTMLDLREEYDRLHASIEIKQSTKRCEDQYWTRCILPHFGAKRTVKSVKRQDIIDLKSKLRETPVQFNRVMALLSHAFNMAEDWGWRDQASNPCYRVKRYKEHPRRRLPTQDEMRRIFAVLKAWRDRQPWYVGLILLLILTGARRSEIQNAKRAWVDGDKLVLPDSKTGGKIIPLNSHAQAIIAALPQKPNNPYLICGTKRGQPLHTPRYQWDKMLEEAGVENLTFHDFRRFFASTIMSNGGTLEQAMQLMGHTQAQTAKRYAFLMDHARKQAMENAGDQLMLFIKEPPALRPGEFTRETEGGDNLAG